MILFSLIGYFFCFITMVENITDAKQNYQMCEIGIKGDFNISELAGGSFSQYDEGIRIEEFSATVPCTTLGMGG